MHEESLHVIERARSSSRASPAASCLCALVVALSSSCASTDDAPKKPDLTAKQYYPLAVGNSWIYRSIPERKDVPPDEVKIVARDGEGFFVDNHGTRLQARSTGIFDGDRFIIEDPLEVGHQWLAVPSASVVERYEITDVGARVTVPAGSFDDCVRVRASQEGPTPDGAHKVTLSVVWTYAPGVGLIELVSRASIDDGPAEEQGRRELLRYQIVSGEGP